MRWSWGTSVGQQSPKDGGQARSVATLRAVIGDSAKSSPDAFPSPSPPFRHRPSSHLRAQMIVGCPADYPRRGRSVRQALEGSIFHGPNWEPPNGPCPLAPQSRPKRRTGALNDTISPFTAVVCCQPLGLEGTHRLMTRRPSRAREALGYVEER
jgi:hypothetical protein